jgi:hypothetical protein
LFVETTFGLRKMKGRSKTEDRPILLVCYLLDEDLASFELYGVIPSCIKELWRSGMDLVFGTRDRILDRGVKPRGCGNYKSRVTGIKYEVATCQQDLA